MNWVAVLTDRKFDKGKLVLTIEYRKGEEKFSDTLTLYDPPAEGVDKYVSKITTEKLENLEKFDQIVSEPNEEKEIPRYKKPEPKVEVSPENSPVDNRPS